MSDKPWQVTGRTTPEKMRAASEAFRVHMADCDDHLVCRYDERRARQIRAARTAETNDAAGEGT